MFGILTDFIGVSHKKFMINNLKSKERRAWARIGKDCIVAYGKLLETHELEQMRKDIDLIKEKVDV